MAGCASKTVITELQLQVGVADSAIEEPDQGKSLAEARPGLPPDPNLSIFQNDRDQGLLIVTWETLEKQSRFRRRGMGKSRRADTGSRE